MGSAEETAGRNRRARWLLCTAVVSCILLSLAPAPPAAAANPPITFIGAGDIAETTARAEASAKVLDGVVAADASTMVWTSGDNAYENASDSDYATKYAPTWGRHRSRTRPVPGNHEYQTPNAAGYFNYFCPTATNCVFPGGTQQKYYSYNLGNWHIVSLNSEIEIAAGSAQMQWLQQDLAANRGGCIAAVFHKPYYNSGTSHGRELAMKPFWDILYAARADIVLNGHEHVYERFAKQNANSAAVADGVRQFTVGTGGAGANTFGTISPNSQARGTAQGVAKFTLNDTGYQWSFMPVAGATYSDTGSEVCNPEPPVSITAPAANAVVQGSAVALAATANSAVAGVQFKVDGTNVGAEDTTSPYGVSWDSTAATEGQHTVTAVARDNAGQTSTSAPVTVTVDNVLDTTAVVEKRVNAGSDDAEQASGAAPVLNSTDLELVTDTATQTIGMRFTGVTVPRGANVTKAYVQFTTDETGSAATSLTIRAEAGNNAATFTTAANNVSSRARTTAAVTWAPTAWSVIDEAGTNQRTPDLSAVVREVTNRSGWTSGNALAVIVSGSGKRVARAFDAQLGSAPLLHVEYQIDRTAPSTPTGLSATATSSSQVNLSWSAATDDTAVTGYRIYRNGTQVATSTGTTYSNTGLTASTAYSYTVAAYDGAGNVSAQSAAASVTTPSGTTTQTLTVAATADATVRSDTPTTNYGTATIIEVDNSPVQDLLLKFAVTIPTGKTVTSAKLRLHNVEASVRGGDVYRTANTTWTEAVTWSTAPAADATPLGGLNAVAVNTWYEVDVKQAITGTATYSFRMRSPNTDGADYRSREGGSATAPQLVIVVQ